jgi:ABC-type transport system substrate-binding protein
MRLSSSLAVAGALLALSACTAATPGQEPLLGTMVAPATPDPNSLVWAISSPPRTLDAARLAADPAGTQIAAQIYDGLVRLRAGSAELAPGIAEDWEVDASGRVFTFTLREGLRFHDGTPLDASAVAWNFRRWMDADHPQHADDFLVFDSLFGGTTDRTDATGRPTSLLEAVEVLDATTVRVRLREPFMPFLAHLAMVPLGFSSPSAVVAQGTAYGSDSDHLPVGSGPFRAVSRDDDGTVLLVPYDGHWSSRPAVPAIRFAVVPDPTVMVELVAGGAVHGGDLPPTTPISGTLAASTVRVTARPPRSTSWLMLNHDRAPLDDERVRRAISMAIDRERLAEEQFGPFALPASQLLPPGFNGHSDAITPTEHEPDRARELLAEAGMADGFDLVVWAPSTPRDYLPNPAGTADAVAGMLRDVGINASVRTKSLRQFLADRDAGRYTAWLIGWDAQSPDPDNTWFWHFGAGRSAAEGQYRNDALAELLLVAQRTLSGTSRAELYRRAADMVAADSARVFLAHARPQVVVSPRLRGYSPGTLGFDDLSTVSLAAPPPGAAVQTPVAGPTTPEAATGDSSTPGSAVPLATATAENGAPQAPGTAADSAAPSASETAAPSGTPPPSGTAVPASPGGPTGTEPTGRSAAATASATPARSGP